MSKFKWSMIAVLALAILFGAVGVVSAQTETPQDPDDTPFWDFRGMMGRRGHHFGMWGGNNSEFQSGLLHDEIVSIMAEKFNLTVDELNTRLEDGETMSEVAISLGWSLDDFRSAMQDARSQAIANLVEDGTLTQDQADWLNQRGAGQMMGGRRGDFEGRRVNPGCPMFGFNSET